MMLGHIVCLFPWVTQPIISFAASNTFHSARACLGQDLNVCLAHMGMGILVLSESVLYCTQ